MSRPTGRSAPRRAQLNQGRAEEARAVATPPIGLASGRGARGQRFRQYSADPLSVRGYGLRSPAVAQTFLFKPAALEHKRSTYK
jgi:hypothetical protein